MLPYTAPTDYSRQLLESEDLLNAFSQYPHTRSIMRQASASTRAAHYKSYMQTENCLRAPSSQEVANYYDIFTQTDDFPYPSMAVFFISEAENSININADIIEKTENHMYHNLLHIKNSTRARITPFEFVLHKDSGVVESNHASRIKFVLGLDDTAEYSSELFDIKPYNREKRGFREYTPRPVEGTIIHFVDVLTEFNILNSRNQCIGLEQPFVAGYERLSFAKRKTIQGFQNMIDVLSLPNVTIYHLDTYLITNGEILKLDVPWELAAYKNVHFDKSPSRKQYIGEMEFRAMVANSAINRIMRDSLQELTYEEEMRKFQRETDEYIEFTKEMRTNLIQQIIQAIINLPE